MSIGEIARRVGRDFEDVKDDVTSMFRDGLLWKSESGQVVFPFDEIRFRFDLP